MMQALSRQHSDLRHLALALASIVTITVVYRTWLHVSNATTVSMTFLLAVLVVAAASRLWVAVVTSIAAVLGFSGRLAVNRLPDECVLRAREWKRGT
jgi:K+-sensing histidine kinase KdpD